MIKYKILKLLGYEPYKVVKVQESWDGEPPYNYWTKLKMIKGVNVKVVDFKNISNPKELWKIIEEDFGDGSQIS